MISSSRLSRKPSPSRTAVPTRTCSIRPLLLTATLTGNRCSSMRPGYHTSPTIDRAPRRLDDPIRRPFCPSVGGGLGGGGGGGQLALDLPHPLLRHRDEVAHVEQIGGRLAA